jgi:imidazolonepropionase-like amidohydrolase
MIVRPGGHAWQVGRVADGLDELRAAAREQLDAGAQVVKVMASGGFSTPGDAAQPELSTDELRAVVGEAHRSSIPVAAHSHATEAIDACLAAGIDTIEHGAFLEAPQAEVMAARKVPLVPTLRAIDVVASGVGLDNQLIEKVDASRERYEASISLAIAAGVPIAAGTDAGTPLNEHGCLVRELERYVELGMPAIQALKAATSNAGRLVGPRVGEVTPGHAADLLVVEGDPRTGLGALRKLRHVVANGSIVDLHWLRATLESFGSPRIVSDPAIELPANPNLIGVVT